MKNRFWLLLAAVGCGVTLFVTDAPATVYARVGVGVGVGHTYRPYWHGHHHPYFRPYYYPYGPACFGPAIVYSMPIYSAATVSAPATVTTRTTTTKTTTVSSAPAAPAPAPASLTPLLTVTAPPYGIPENNSLVKSPFSNFTISDIGMKPGTVIYDSYTGQPFRIP